MQAVITMPEEADSESEYVLTERCPLPDFQLVGGLVGDTSAQPR